MALTVSHLNVPKRVRDVCFTLNKGELVGLIGPNGSGKSSLLKALTGLLPYQGSVTLNGQAIERYSLKQRAQLLSYLPQAASSAWALTVAEVIALGRLPWGDVREDLVRVAAEQTGVSAWLGRRITELSGGEQARVWLARAMVGEPQVLLADEPIASLDLYYQRHVLNSLKNLAQAGSTVLVALHDLNLAARYCDRLCLMDQGRIHAFGAPFEVLNADNVAEVFNVDLSELSLTLRPFA